MKTKFIAEICSNHNGSVDRALSLIDTAAAMGCAGVKFQLFRLEQLFSPEVLSHPDYEFARRRKAWELPLEWLPVLAERCKEHRLQFGVTPFHIEAVEQIVPFVDFIKIASYNLLYEPLLKAIAATGKPVIMSAGMATEEEIVNAVEVLHKNHCNDLVLLHCVSEYPASLDCCNPDALTKLWAALATVGVIGAVGWSDHTGIPGVIYYFSLARRAEIIEFHLDLDGNGWEYDIGHCWLPEDIAPIIATVKQAQLVAQGGNKQMDNNERLWRADPLDGLRPLREIRGRL